MGKKTEYKLDTVYMVATLKKPLHFPALLKDAYAFDGDVVRYERKKGGKLEITCEDGDSTIVVTRGDEHYDTLMEVYGQIMKKEAA